MTKINANSCTILNGIVADADRINSPNCSQRSAEQEISLLVIHNISLPPGQYGTGCVEQLFCNVLDSKQHEYFRQLEGLRVSAHVLVDRMGMLTQFVSMNDKAWHAGQSEFKGVENCNEYSIGVEVEGSDFEAFTDAQYESLVSLSNAIMRSYPAITADRIVGHSDIAPGRKTDPGPFFDWVRYKEGLSS